jgi:Molybdopterin-binding domain of aldehyde dehydrogenase
MWKLSLHHLRWVFMQRTVPRVRQVRRVSGNAASSISTQEPEFCGRSCLAITKVTTTCVIEDRFIMDTIATELRIAKSHAAPRYLGPTSEIGFVQNARVENLDIETVTSKPFLPANRKWAIRFNAGGTVTIVLGMRDYGRGWYSAYFAGLVTARLGIPFQRVRIYYSATLPAVLQTPVPSSVVFHRGHIGPVATAVADVIEGMCDQVVQRARLAFAAMAGVGTGDVGFDQSSGGFFVLDRNRSSRILEIAATTRGTSSVSTEFARRLQQGDNCSIAK